MIPEVRMVLRSLIEFVYPPRCALCDVHIVSEDGVKLCPSCASSLRRLEADFTAPHLKRIWFDRARSAFPFEGAIRHAIHGFKYEERFDLIDAFAAIMFEELERFDELDLIIPVPLHRRRLRRRGFNQAAMIAKKLGRKIEVSCNLSALVRQADTSPQVGRERGERIDAMKGAFEVRNAQVVKGKRILLLDDVLTTGATVNECARMLKKAGAARVDVLTIARTL